VRKGSAMKELLMRFRVILVLLRFSLYALRVKWITRRIERHTRAVKKLNGQINRVELKSNEFYERAVDRLGREVFDELMEGGR